MKAHNRVSASDLRVRLCFLVKTRKATGRRTFGWISTARMRGVWARELGGRGSKGSEEGKAEEEGGMAPGFGRKKALSFFRSMMVDMLGWGWTRG